jgi:HprK-related kinase A
VLIGELSRRDLARRLRGDGVHLITGAFTSRVRASLPHFVDEFAAMYADYGIEDPPGIDDVRLQVAAPSWPRRFIAPQVMVCVDSGPTFGPLPAYRAYTTFETSLNWGAALSDIAPMILHAAVLERDGRGLILPAPSSSGKSTLCAALSWRGWRLLSDEMAIFDISNGRLRPNPRPVSLKNKAVDVIRSFDPRAQMSRIYTGTPKGNIGYMRPPPEAVARASETAIPSLVVSPNYVEDSTASLVRLERVRGFELLTDNAVNYSSMLKNGFDILTDIVERCGIYRITYSDLDAAIELIDRLHRDSEQVALS